MSTAISLVNQLPSTKKQIESFKELVLNELESGYINPVEIAIQFKCLESFLKNIQTDSKFKDLTVNKAIRDNVKEYPNAKVEVCEVGTKYDFSECGDSQLIEYENEINRLSELKKARENWIKTFKIPTADQSTGEIINPCLKTSTTSLKITIK